MLTWSKAILRALFLVIQAAALNFSPALLPSEKARTACAMRMEPQLTAVQLVKTGIAGTKVCRLYLTSFSNPLRVVASLARLFHIGPVAYPPPTALRTICRRLS